MAIVKYSQGQINEVVSSDKVVEIDNPLLEKDASDKSDSKEENKKDERPKWTK